MYLLLVMLLNGQPPPQPWHLMVGRTNGQYLTWERHNFPDQGECIEALGLAILTNPADAYCERDPPQA